MLVRLYLRNSAIVYFGNENSDEDCVKMEIRDTKIKFYFYNRNKSRSIEIDNLAKNKLYHIGIVLKETVGFLYVNGKLVKREYLLDTRKLVRNHRTSVLRSLNEQPIISDIKIFKGFLSTQEVLEEYEKS